ncbi:cytochrome c oxidase subunit 3 [Granulicella arctica]|uniref:Cytochrome c oxidase subunit 3 n=1 Tax=Granulicella arctica TaxID=940613 RepID=A0A7Y9PIV3_9BACT|nr:cytochrome c oxidase subunit 3 [Granulicella arctica]NYF80657.1 cytochrome c oxidase subunit 3 [Granulicella arctica]
MPAIITPIGTEHEKKKRRVDDHDSGHGRRPPNDKNDKRTGGGGDNDGWNSPSQGRRGPREKLSRFRLFVFFALAGDLMFFVAIVSAFFVSQASSHFDAYNHYVNQWLPTAVPPILWLNTAALILSSLTMEIARRHMFREVDVMDEWLGLGKPSTRNAMPWLAATVALGIAFLIGQWIAWNQLATQHVFFRSNPSSHFFFLITGVHGFHLILGVAALIGALIALYASKQMENRQVFVDCAAWYWHSMGLFWIFLFVLLAFFQ